MSEVNDKFELWDLRIEVVGEQSDMVCNHTAGDYFELSGENLTFPEGRPVSVYALAAILPLLPAKQRMTRAAGDVVIDDLARLGRPLGFGLDGGSRGLVRVSVAPEPVAPEADDPVDQQRPLGILALEGGPSRGMRRGELGRSARTEIRSVQRIGPEVHLGGW